MSDVTCYSQTRCSLGEGPMWHPVREQLFWFDILGKRLFTLEDGTERSWQFDRHVSAAGWLDRDGLLVASETDLFRFDVNTARQERILTLEANNPLTRSNDGRADPWGGFWVGTMGKQLEPGAGSIYRYWRGELRRLKEGLTIPNSICFSSDGSVVYYTDTPTRQIMRQPLDPQTGWPDGPAQVFVDLRDGAFNPDGSVVDAQGYLWNAQWGASRIARYAPTGEMVMAITFPARQISCPAFGGEGLQTLFATSASEGLEPAGAEDGSTFAVSLSEGEVGQPEPQVLI
jgi:sugar lactone lactonase YvrE